MSDSLLVLVPTDPNWSPTREAADAAVAYLRSIMSCEGPIEPVFSEAIKFHAGMENWSGVTCPTCGSDLEDWFFRELDRAFEDTEFENLQITTPCCGDGRSLNDLNFVRPAAFGRFAIEAHRPDLDPTPDHVSRLETLLGHPVRKVWDYS